MKIPCGGFFVSDDFEFEGKTLHLSEQAKAWTKDHRELENKDAHNQHPIHLSFISKELLKTQHIMNPTRTGTSGAYNEGTGAIGGWEKSEMRTYFKETIKPLIPSTVRSAILEVTKTHTSYITVGSSVAQTTQDDVWLPAWNEISSSSAMYGSLFSDNASRIKYKVDTSSDSKWWTREAASNQGFYRIDLYGDGDFAGSKGSYGVVLGFCL